MPNKIHHMTKKKAAKKGFALDIQDNVYVVRAINGGDHVLAFDEDVNKAIEKAETEPMLPPTEGSVVKAKYKRRYGRTACNGDAMALAVNKAVRIGDGIDLDALAKIARDNGLDMARWSHLNVGQQSMSVRNCLRGMLRRGERDVIVGGQTFMANTDDDDDSMQNAA
jgi:hypothetical protein